MDTIARQQKPVVYSCSGCSSAAQLANHVAVRLDRSGAAEMSCIAGVGGDVPSLVKLAKAGRPIIALDGCQLACARHCLERHGITPDQHHELQIYGYASACTRTSIRTRPRWCCCACEPTSSS